MHRARQSGKVRKQHHAARQCPVAFFIQPSSSPKISSCGILSPLELLQWFFQKQLVLAEQELIHYLGHVAELVDLYFCFDVPD